MKKLLICAVLVAQSAGMVAITPDESRFGAYQGTDGETFQEFTHGKDGIRFFKRYMQTRKNGIEKEEVINFECGNQSAPTDDASFKFTLPICQQLHAVHKKFEQEYPVLRNYRATTEPTNVSFYPSFKFSNKSYISKNFNHVYVGEHILDNDELKDKLQYTTTPSPWKVAGWFYGSAAGYLALNGLYQAVKNMKS